MSTLELEKPKNRIDDQPVVTFDMLPQSVQQAIQNCDADIASDRLYSTDEVFREIDEWLEKP